MREFVTPRLDRGVHIASGVDPVVKPRDDEAGQFMNLDSHLNTFLRSRAMNGDADSTIKKTKLRLKKHFIGYLNELGKNSLEHLTADLLRDWQEDLAFKQSPKGLFYNIQFRNLIIQNVKSFCHWLYLENYLATDLSLKLDATHAPKRLPQHVLEEKEIHEILLKPDLNTLTGYRDRLLLELFYGTGIRCQEMQNLKLKDVDLDNGYLFIEQGKGAKDRVVPLGKGPLLLLKHYIKEVRPKLIVGTHDFLIISSQRPAPLSASQMARQITFYAKQAGLTKRVYPHLFRHSCATHLIRNGAPIRCVQELLGHANINTTQIYSHLTITDLKKAHAKYHPREKCSRTAKK